VNRRARWMRLLGVGMVHYRAYLLDHNRHVISVANLQCADEREARERAQQLVALHSDYDSLEVAG
jgi:hypothetical protein